MYCRELVFIACLCKCTFEYMNVFDHFNVLCFTRYDLLLNPYVTERAMYLDLST